MTVKIRLAIIGVGWAGARHAQAIAELASAGRNPFVVECLADSDAEFLNSKAKELRGWVTASTADNNRSEVEPLGGCLDQPQTPAKASTSNPTSDQQPFKLYTSYRDALSDPSVDAVSICTPHALHCEMAIAAAEAGKHVLVEKPID
jgi:predicted dehydrogenase